jgi:predicted  nucleic acid-binding Zn-ribbon protein
LTDITAYDTLWLTVLIWRTLGDFTTKEGVPLSTYDYDKILSDYAHGRITVEMAMGHSLQHIGKLYADQAAMRTEIDALKKQVNRTETTVDHLKALIDKARAKQKLQTTANHPKPDLS